MSSPQIENAAETIQTLTEDAAALAARFRQLTAALQQSSCQNVDSASQHLALYQEVVQTLQVVTLFGSATGCWFSCAYKTNTILEQLSQYVLCCLRQTLQQIYDVQLTCNKSVKSCTVNSVL